MRKNITASKRLLPHVSLGKRQVAIKIRVKVPKWQSEFPVKISQKRYMRLSDHEYQNLSEKHNYDINAYKELLIEACEKVIANNNQLTNQGVYEEIKKIQVAKALDVLSGYQGYELFEGKSDEEIKKILNNADIDNQIFAEDLSELLADKELEFDKDKREKEILASKKIRNTLERTIRQYELINDWNSENLILQIGYLFTLKQDNERPRISRIARGLIVNIYDFSLHLGRKLMVSDFNDDFCKSLVKFIRDYGVYNSSLGKTPMELDKGEADKNLAKKRKVICSYRTLYDKVKSLNQIITALREIGVQVDVRKKFKADSFVDGNVIKDDGTNKEHHLTPEEINYLLQLNNISNQEKLAVDTLLILTFCGGLRGVRNFDVAINWKEESLDVFHNKKTKRAEIPIFDELKTILSKYEYEFPEFPKEDIISDILKKIFKKLGWNRLIKTVNTKVNKKEIDPYYFTQPLHEMIDLTFARKSFVLYARKVFKMKDEEIIEYTTHGSVEILRNYMGEYTLEEKKEKLKSIKN